jgi:putative endonuclease
MPLSIPKGQRAETRAITHLRKQGLKLIGRNFRCRYGEIDIIMQQSDELVFIEVKMRSSSHFGEPFEYVHSRKQAKIIKTAKIFLQQHKKHQHQPCRFDVIGITPALIHWIPNAFNNTQHH